MKPKLGIATAAVACIGLLGYWLRPTLQPDGTSRHNWKVTAITPSNTVLVIDGVAQSYTKNTAYPRRAFGNDIRVRWFRKPIHEIKDEDGNRWTAVMVD